MSQHPGPQLRRIIPRSLLSRVVRALRLYSVYAQDTFPAPMVLFAVLRVLFVANISFPLCLTGCAEAWSDSDHLMVIFNAISVFWRWGGLWQGERDCLISCCILIGLFVVAYIPNLVFAALYHKNGRISRFCCLYTSITMDIFINFLAMWSAPQLGTLLKIILSGNYVYIALFVVILAIYVGHIFYALTMLTPQVVYAPGRSLTWIGSDLIVMYVVMQLQSFVTRVVEIVDIPRVRMAFCIATVIISILWLTFSFLASPGISRQMDIFMVMFQMTNLVVFVFKAFYLFGMKVSSQIVLVMYFPLVAIGYLLTRFFYMKHETSVLKLFDELMEAECLEDELENSFKSPLRFLDACQIAFRNGHPLLLLWKPFTWGIERWPKNSKVWMQFMRFLAIYPESMDLLLSVYERFRELKLRPFSRNAFVLFLHRCINSRSRDLSKELQRHMTGIEKRINKVNSLMISFWSSIENNTASMTFFLANKLNASISELETMFVCLTIMYPNNYRVAARYAQFLNQYESDVVRAEFWLQKANRIQEGTEVFVDVTSQNAFQVFPRIPKNLNEITHLESTELDAPIETDASLASSKRGPAPLFICELDNDISPSQIREVGMGTTVSSVRNVIAITVFFFLVVYFIGAFTPSFLGLQYTMKLDGYFRGTKLMADIGFRIERISTLLLSEALTSAKGILSKSEEMQILTGSSDISNITPYREQIAEEVEVLNQNVHDFDQMLGNELNMNSELGEILVRGRLWMSSVGANDKGDVQLYQYEDTIDEALAAIIGHFSLYVPRYSDEGVDFMKEYWFLNSVINSQNVSTASMTITRVMCDAGVDVWRDYKTSIIIFMTSYLVLWICFAVLMAVCLWKVQKQWSVTVKSIHTLPHKAVQDVITKLSKTPRKSQAYDKYRNLFIQISTARTVSSGTTMRAPIAAVVFNFAISMAMLCALASGALNPSEDLVRFPFKVMNTRLQNACALAAVETVLRRLSLDQNVVFYDDTKEKLLALSTRALIEYAASNTQMLFGEYGGQDSGIISGGSALLDDYLTYDPEWITQERMYNRLKLMPLSSASIVLLQTYSMFVRRCGVDGLVFKNDDEEILLLIHFLIDELSESLYKDVVIATYNWRYESSKANFTNAMFAISGIGLFAGIAMTAVLISFFDTMETAIRFCIACLSMVESKYVRVNSHIRSLFAGDFIDRDFEKDSMLSAWKKVEDEIPECTIVLDEGSNIIAYNARAREMLDFDEQIVARTNIHDVLAFRDNQCAVAGSTTTVTILGSNESKEMVVKTINCNFRHARRILFMRDEDEIEKTKKQISEIEAEIVFLKYRVMPEAVKDKLDAHLKMELHNNIFCVIEMADFDNFAPEKTADQLSDRFQAFFGIVDDEVSRVSNAVKLRNLGVAGFICFNMVHRKSNFYELVNDVLKLCRRVESRCAEASISVRVGTVFEKSAVAGMISPDRLLFDVYASAMEVSYAMARKAAPGSILMCTRTYELLPPDCARMAALVQLEWCGQPYTAYSLVLSE